MPEKYVWRKKRGREGERERESERDMEKCTGRFVA
jgi:hypothetical protein